MNGLPENTTIFFLPQGFHFFLLLEFFYIWLRFGCRKAEDICMEVGPRRWLGPPLFRYLRCKIGVQ